MAFWPTVLEKDGRTEKWYDIPSKLLKDRIILLSGEVNDDLATSIVGQLLYLNQEDPDSEITIYINSPGGSITSGMAIYDTMNHITNPINTVCVGMAASMGAFLLCGGTPGRRAALPNSEVMIHQPLGGAQGQATEIDIVAKHIMRIRKRIYDIMAKACNKTFDEMEKACERDNYLTADEALAFGLIDKIYQPGEEKNGE